MLCFGAADLASRGRCFLWGFSYSYSTVLVFLQKDEKWGRESLSSLAAIGTTMLGLQLLLPCVKSLGETLLKE